MTVENGEGKKGLRDIIFDELRREPGPGGFFQLGVKANGISTIYGYRQDAVAKIIRNSGALCGPATDEEKAANGLKGKTWYRVFDEPENLGPTNFAVRGSAARDQGQSRSGGLNKARRRAGSL